ncbi:SDR family oxidoreductase [Jeongeupia naejangsanensis]|uniref:SDR family oxidoreductase n=1 Tax=Jeongeupia naejangsanensis TaxID=613195 RepID=A0ABS2BJ85_9NEIS|nr:SDR family oxidoreductase [Jeongeupia naejangsanensis]MBM3115505.1 SDR family oxidoreductase [Jeongeupia naejangsanensis]
MRGLIVFGASRGVGLEVAGQARAQGRAVRALLRESSDASALEAIGVDVVRGDALDADAVGAALAGLPADTDVVTTLGSFGPGVSVDYLGNRNVIDATERAGLKRLVLVTSLGGSETWPHLSERSRKGFGGAVREKTLAEAWLRTSGLEHTIIRPGGLRDGPALGSPQRIENAEAHGFVRRADVAAVVLDCLVDPATIGRAISVVDPACPA